MIYFEWLIIVFFIIIINLIWEKFCSCYKHNIVYFQDDYLKILTDEGAKDFAAINFNECFESIREERNLRKVAKLLYIFLPTTDKVETYVQSNSFDNCMHRFTVKILNIFDPELQFANTKPMMNTKLQKLLSDLKKLKIQLFLVIQTLMKDLNPSIRALWQK